MLNGGSMVWGFCVYFVYMVPLETDVLRKHRFQKMTPFGQNFQYFHWPLFSRFFFDGIKEKAPKHQTR